MMSVNIQATVIYYKYILTITSFSVSSNPYNGIMNQGRPTPQISIIII